MATMTYKCSEELREAIRTVAYNEGHSNNTTVILAALNAYQPVQKELQRRCKNKSGKKLGK
jgi:hypothetical protein